MSIGKTLELVKTLGLTTQEDRNRILYQGITLNTESSSEILFKSLKSSFCSQPE